MENATKALLIAGAVLIVIVIISIGTMIAKSGEAAAGEVQNTTDSYLVEQFNKNFDIYQGTQRGSSVTGLLSRISSNNSTNASEHTISVIIDGTTYTTSSTITAAAADIVSSAKYKVVMSNTDNEGYITEITITKQ